MPLPLDMTANIIDSEGHEPQRMNNGMIFVTVPGLNDSFLQLAVQSFDMPKENQNTLQVSHLNENRKFAGRVDYQDIAVQIIDYVDIDVAKTIAAWRKMVYNPANGRIGWKRYYAGTGHIELYGPNGRYQRGYELRGVWPSGWDPGQIDDTSDDIVRVSLTLVIDKAIPVQAATTTDYTTD